MEPNVDRGMWAIVSLLIAVVIGAATMMIFPDFVGAIGDEMTALMESPAAIINKSGLDKKLRPSPQEWFSLDEVYHSEKLVYRIRGFSSNIEEVAGLEGAKPKDIVIPSNFNGKPIVRISSSAFEGQGIESITFLGNNIEEIGTKAFTNNNITKVVLPDSVESVGDYTFSENNISELVIGKGLKRIGIAAFDTNKIKEVVLPEGFEVLGSRAFNHNEITSITIPDTMVFGEGNRYFHDNVGGVVTATMKEGDLVDDSNRLRFRGYKFEAGWTIAPTE